MQALAIIMPTRPVTPDKLKCNVYLVKQIVRQCMQLFSLAPRPSALINMKAEKDVLFAHTPSNTASHRTSLAIVRQCRLQCVQLRMCVFVSYSICLYIYKLLYTQPAIGQV